VKIVMLRQMRTTQGKFVVVIVPMIIAFTLLTSVVSTFIDQRDLRRRLDEEMHNVASTQALAVRIPVWNYEGQTLQSIVEAMLTNPNISAAEVRDNFGTPVARADRPLPSTGTWTISAKVQSPVGESSSDVIGLLLLTYNDARIRAEVRDQLARDVLLLIILVLTISGSAVVAHTITIGRPLSDFLRAIHRAEDPRLRQPVPIRSDDEIGTIMAAYNRLLAKLAGEEHERTLAAEELRSARDRAERALADLRSTQHSLIQAEKMASLGQMVAGVAHEINTPVGIALTAASHLAEETRQLNRSIESGGLKRSQLTEFMETATESAKLLQSNMHRASELIQSFKQVAVDRSSDERRTFDLRPYVDEVIHSLGPRLKKTPHQVVVEGVDQLLIDSYPGAIAQLLTNFVINALVHAFEDGPPGRITITITTLPNNFAELRFSDNGKGIPPEHVNRIFEPFFTTKRGAGGSGLGMHICFNLVTQQMGGTLAVESEVGKGTSFVARFPVVAPPQKIAANDKDQAA
jgi:two-component system, NtrC family, sensor kinase